jgi:endonuclease/exonuclease/phosphatase family metal-dependent hydrolase
MRKYFFIGGLGSIVAVCGCGGDVSETLESSAEQSVVATPGHAKNTHAPACVESQHRPLRVTTFNAALAPDVAPYVAERKPLVIQSLARQAKQVDALCVQEFWRDSDFGELQTRVADDLPVALRPAPRPGTGSCTLDELITLGQCLGTNCPAAAGAELVGCAQAYCAREVGSLSGGCLGCIMNNLDADLSVCAGEGGQGDPAIYGGSFDVGLLTRLPVLAFETTKELDSYFVRMGVLYAELVAPDGKPVHAFCTHLGSPLDIVPYAGKHESWHQEHLVQVRQLRAYISEKAQAGERVIVMGDMNTGPDGRGLLGDWSDNYAELVGNDLTDAYYEQRNADCTWCPDNVFVDDASPGKLIDHILIRGFRPARAHVTRVFDQSVELTVGTESFAAHLSDHYGLRGTLQ